MIPRRCRVRIHHDELAAARARDGLADFDSARILLRLNA